MKYNVPKYIICLFILINFLNAQFIDIEAEIDLRQIRENDRFYFDNFQNEIDNFFLSNSFGVDIEYLELSSNIHIIIESIIDKNSQKMLNGQIIITNRSDIMMPLKSFSFPINELDNVSYNPNTFSPLNSLLEFIAHILIANELDTYESKGGNEHYNIALTISQLGKESHYSKGWNERWKKCKQIQENFFLRDMKYYYFLVYDNWHNEDFENLSLNIENFHIAMESNSSFIGIDNNTINFFKAFSGEIIKYYSNLNFIEGLSFLSNYDIDNKTMYLDAIKSLQK